MQWSGGSFLQQVGWLFNYIGLQDKLIPYYYASANSPGFQYFSSICACVGNKNNFAAPALGINQSYINVTTSVIVNDVVNPFAKALFDDLRTKQWQAGKKCYQWMLTLLTPIWPLHTNQMYLLVYR